MDYGVKTRYHNNYFSLLVNDIFGDMFFPSRDIAHQLHQISMSRFKFIGVTLGHSRVKISFLTFTDDTIFSKANLDICHY